MEYTINRKDRKVSFKPEDEIETMSFEETFAFIYLLMRKMASSHRA